MHLSKYLIHCGWDAFAHPRAETFLRRWCVFLALAAQGRAGNIGGHPEEGRAAEQPGEDSVCFNNCSGHGTCSDYACTCFVGYSGDDCRYSFLPSSALEGTVIPILGAGHYNLTKQNASTVISKSSTLLVGFSSHACHKCIAYEPEYANLTILLDSLATENAAFRVPFARFDVNLNKQIATQYGAQDLPCVIFFRKGKASPYRGPHSASGIFRFVNKQLRSKVTRLSSVEDVHLFMNASTPQWLAAGAKSEAFPPILIVGFFSAHGDIEEDEYEDFSVAASQLQAKEDVFFGEVVRKDVSKVFKSEKKLIDRTPALVLVNQDSGLIRSLNLDDFYDNKVGGLTEWIAQNSIPLVGHLTGNNFQLYESIGRPMLMMFLDLSLAGEQASGGAHSVLQGRSGAILNEDLLDEFRVVAKEHHEKILFVYLDGVEHQDRMKSLGLYGGKERLPSVAFNTREGIQLPFPEELPVNRDSLLRFCAEFLSGKLRSADDAKAMAKKSLTSTVPMSQKNRAVRQQVRPPPEVVRGVSEAWGDSSPGDLAVLAVSASSFDEVVMQQAEDRDVVLLLHAKNCEPCAHFAVYFKKMAQRFAELSIPSLLIARMDVTAEAPRAELGLMVGKLPLLVMMPSGNKNPPWVFYSGVGKMQMMMKWVQDNAAVHFDLPHLPHLSPSEVGLYKQQVKEREEALANQRERKREL